MSKLPPQLVSGDPHPALEISSIYRIIDANGNRAREGLRVVEDCLRFDRDDSFLSGTCKGLRHELSKTLEQLNENQAFARCRSTQTDVGVHQTTDREYQRQSLADVARVNLGRIAEALRTLEEVTKTIAPGAAKEIEQIRYRVYSLGKAFEHAQRGGRQFPSPLLYVLIDLRYGNQQAFQERVETLIQAGVDVIQLRDKQADDRALMLAARRLRAITKKSRTQFIMNDRPDLAMLARADGVHVGQDELTVADVRGLVGPTMAIGVSTHSMRQARQAVMEGADYLGVGPVFSSRTKEFDEYAGVEFVRDVSREIDLPGIAIGGIDLQNVQRIIDHGGRRIAVGHAVWHAEDPLAAARQFRETLSTAEPSSGDVNIAETSDGC